MNAAATTERATGFDDGSAKYCNSVHDVGFTLNYLREIKQARATRLEPFRCLAKTLDDRPRHLLNWFLARGVRCRGWRSVSVAITTLGSPL